MKAKMSKTVTSTPFIEYGKPVFVVIVMVSILAYALFQARTLIHGPTLTVTSPKNGATMSQSFVEIAGTAGNISEIELNGRDITVDENGAFREPLLLGKGYTILTLKARDRFGREVQSTLELIYQ